MLTIKKDFNQHLVIFILKNEQGNDQVVAQLSPVQCQVFGSQICRAGAVLAEHQQAIDDLDRLAEQKKQEKQAAKATTTNGNNLQGPDNPDIADNEGKQQPLPTEDPNKRPSPRTMAAAAGIPAFRKGDKSRSRTNAVSTRRIGKLGNTGSNDQLDNSYEMERSVMQNSSGQSSPTPPPVDHKNIELTTGQPVPADGSHMETRPDGQLKGYIVLTPAERAKGFVRPVRDRYRHVGPLGPLHPTRLLTTEERERFCDPEPGADNFVLFEIYPSSTASDGGEGGVTAETLKQTPLPQSEGAGDLANAPVSPAPGHTRPEGRFWTESEIAKVKKGGCQTVTIMGMGIAETYARDPKFYSMTFCSQCKTHLPVDEFIWVDSIDETHLINEPGDRAWMLIAERVGS